MGRPVGGSLEAIVVKINCHSHNYCLVRVPCGGPKVTFAKPIDTFFELSITSAPSHIERDCHAKEQG